MKKNNFRRKKAMLYFTVGPSQVYPTLPKHIDNALKKDIPSLNHRGVEFKKLYSETDINMKKLLNIPKNYQIFFVSSALEAMERTILGTVEKTSFHIVTGSFGKSWMEIASKLGKQVQSSSGVDLKNLHLPGRIETICITQNDTSTGIQIPMEEIYSLKKKYPKVLIALDVVSSIPYIDINYSLIDITFFSVQKGFGLPAGLGVMIVSPDALEKAQFLQKKDISTGSYHSLTNLSEKYKTFQTPETPNVLNIFLLNNICLDMLKKGIGKIRAETDRKAKFLYNFFDNHSIYKPVVQLIEFRSKTTVVIDTKGESKKLRYSLPKKGYNISSGYGENKDNQIRIANFPAHTMKDVKNLISNLKL